MKVLVTGGCRFIGAYISDQLIEAGHQILMVDNLSPRRRGDVECCPRGSNLSQYDFRI